MKQVHFAFLPGHALEVDQGENNKNKDEIFDASFEEQHSAENFEDCFLNANDDATENENIAYERADTKCKRQEAIDKLFTDITISGEEMETEGATINLTSNIENVIPKRIELKCKDMVIFCKFRLKHEISLFGSESVKTVCILIQPFGAKCTENVDQRHMDQAREIIQDATPAGYTLGEVEAMTTTGRNPHRWIATFTRDNNDYNYETGCQYISAVPKELK
ncbi:unnamed protein product [Brassicogethes aeneus]|uniref:Uncharacterized protein n=1 Tax=Brassicogethes aeneus TaxID=1431903 RepID=A0A9P0AZN9_BRAAE|nr:unnamed protein product [Brassicogethes aeneus]